MPRMSGSLYLAKMTNEYGISHVFFLPAIASSCLLEMSKIGIKPIFAHSEIAVAYMADGYARASHKPGICMAQSVGAASIAAGLQDAYLGLSPVICITGCKTPYDRHRHAYQEIEHAPLYRPVTKFNGIIHNLTELPLLLRQAFREATSGVPAPVHLDIMGHLGQVLEGDADLDITSETQFGTYPAFRSEPEPRYIQEAVNFLSKAKKPVIIAGGGVVASQAEKEVVALAEALDIPVVTSTAAKATIPANHRLAIGVMGDYSRPAANKLIAEADFALVIGSHMGSQVTNEWLFPRHGTPIIQIDIDPKEIGRHYPVRTPLVGDAKLTLQAMIKIINGGKKNLAWVKRAQQLLMEWRKQNQRYYESNDVPIRPERICKELTEYLPKDAMLVVDTGQAGMWSAAMIDLMSAKQSYIRAAGSLGWAFPAAIGAKCAQPERPVVCFIGDGGFWYHLAELETARRYGINVVTVINDNSAFGQVKDLYVDMPGNDLLWKYQDFSFAQYAQQLGCFGIRVTEPDKIKAAFEAAFNSNKPAVIDIMSDVDVAAAYGWKYD